jgi:hypothetical protein
MVGRERRYAARTHLAHALEECLAGLAEHRVALRVGDERARREPDVLDGLGRPPGESSHGRRQGVGEVKSCGFVSGSLRVRKHETLLPFVRTCTH